MPYANWPIDVDSLPQWEEKDHISLDPRYKTYRYIILSMTLVIVLIALGLVFLQGMVNLPDSFIYIVAGMLILGFGAAFLLVNLGYKHKYYILRDKDIIFQQGIFWQTQTIVPFARIQHSAIHQNALQKKLAIARFNIYTAGGSSSDLKLDGLPMETAQKLKDFINDKF